MPQDNASKAGEKTTITIEATESGIMVGLEFTGTPNMADPTLTESIALYAAQEIQRVIRNGLDSIRKASGESGQSPMH